MLLLCAQAGGAAPGATGGEAAAAEAGGEEGGRDPETLDDSEFYQGLLREFLEGGSAGGTGGWYTVSLPPRPAHALPANESLGSAGGGAGADALGMGMPCLLAQCDGGSA